MKLKSQFYRSRKFVANTTNTITNIDQLKHIVDVGIYATDLDNMLVIFSLYVNVCNEDQAVLFRLQQSGHVFSIISV